MTINEATVLEQTVERLADLTELLGDVQARVERLEGALCIVISDETLPMDTRMDIASAMLPTLEEAA
jgi:hypothetical protein